MDAWETGAQALRFTDKWKNKWLSFSGYLDHDPASECIV